MGRLIFDTLVLMDFLKAVPQARSAMMAADDHVISMISWMELMSLTGPEDEERLRRFLGCFEPVMVDKRIAERAAVLRRDHKLELPEAIVWATAQITSRILVTREGSAYPAQLPGIRMAYKV